MNETNDWPEDLQVKEIAKMDTVRLVRFALDQSNPSVEIIQALNRRAMKIYMQVNTVTDIEHRIKSMQENIEALP